MRSVLVMLVIAAPTVLLGGNAADSGQLVALVALCMGVLTFIEYSALFPSLVEFRDAPPFNRVRFLSLFATVLILSTIVRGQTSPSTLTDFIEALGNKLGGVIDVPYSPVRLVVLMLPEDMSLRHLILVAPLIAALLHPLAGPPAAALAVTVMSGFDRVGAK